jgi:hypothetical protein
MIRKLIVLVCLFFTFISWAQEGTASPYSIYGIGDLRFKGTADNRAMGGLTIFSDSIHLNFQNPASYSSLKLTAFTVSGSSLNSKLKTNDQSESARRATLDYFAFGIPMGKVGAAFGVVPFTSVGYNIENSISATTTTINKYNGSGGLNKVFLGAGYTISSKFSIGANLDYNFGKIETNSSSFMSDVQYGYRERNRSDLKGVSFTTALNFQTKLNDKLSFVSALTFSPESKLKTINERTLSTLSNNQTVIDQQVVPVDDVTMILPTRLSFGAAIGKSKKWMLGSELVYRQSSASVNRFNDLLNGTFENAFKYTIGGYYIPKYNSFTSYLSTVSYRGGLRYENTGLVVAGESINDMGFNFGLGLPISGNFSNVNVGFEFGKRGTTNQGLVQENYFNVTVALSFNDKWFVKRLYN